MNQATRAAAPLRGFLIAVIITIGIPALLLFLSMSSPDLALVIALSLAPLFAYEFPIALFLPDSGIWGVLASLLLLLAVCVVFGFVTRRRSPGGQIVWAFICLLAWCGLWWAISHLAGVNPHETRLRM